MLQVLDATQVRRWAVACVQSLDAHREAIDRLNVFPVPDSDTGSNLLHTMRAALDALLRAPARTRNDPAAAMAVLARGALTGARGNSGVIISQFLRGFSDALTAARDEAGVGDGGGGVGQGHRDGEGGAGGEPGLGTSRGEPRLDATGAAGPAGAGGVGGAADAGSAGSAADAVGAEGAGSAGGTGGVAGAGTAADAEGAGSAAGAGGAVDPADAVDTASAGRLGGAFAAGGVLGPGLREALVRGADVAGRAMADPMPGTMLTVLSAVADAVRDESSDALQDVAVTAARAAGVALAETPRQLAVLADAGVVDAGGRGVVVLFDALVSVVTGQPAALAAAQRAVADRGVGAGGESSLFTARESGSDAFAYEVMYLIEEPTGAVDGLRNVLVGLGDSVSVVGDGAGLWSVHVHCNDIGGAIEAGIDAGRLRQIRVARFADAPSPEASRFTKDRAVVVPSVSAELTDLLISEGVTVFQADMRDEATAYRLLEAITGTAAAHVTVLPSSTALTEAADEASIRAVAAGQDVVVVPCASPVQVLAAVAVHDPRRRSSDDVVAMAEAAAATRRGEVVVAEEAAITWIGPCAAGDVLGFVDGEVMLIEPGPPDVGALDRAVSGVVGRMLTMGGELVTALLGAQAPDELATELEDFLRREHPETELVTYHGGQPDAVLVVGVE